MKSSSLRILSLSMFLVLPFSFAYAESGGDEEGGAVYTMSNDAQGNQIIEFDRDSQGMLHLGVTVATTGAGAGGGLDSLGSQQSLVLSNDKRWLIAVNAGSNDISVLRTGERTLRLVDKKPSGGTFPVSAAIFHNYVYVLNNGGAANISGFTIDRNGKLTPLANSTRSLGSGAFGQIGYDAEADVLLITDKANNRLLSFTLDGNGLPSANAVVTTSAGSTPFSFAFDDRGHALMAEAASNAVSSYAVHADGSASVISASVANGQKATCWIVSSGRRYAFTTNPGTQSISAFQIDRSGKVSLLKAIAATGNRPLDAGVAEHGHFLYALDPANAAIDAFRVEHDGSLTSLGNTAGPIAAFAQGLAVK